MSDKNWANEVALHLQMLPANLVFLRTLASGFFEAVSWSGKPRMSWMYNQDLVSGVGTQIQMAMMMLLLSLGQLVEAGTNIAH